MKQIQKKIGSKIAADNELVEAVRIEENDLPRFETKTIKFIKDIPKSKRNVTVKSTSKEILVSKAGINRVSVKSISPKYSRVFRSICSLLKVQSIPVLFKRANVIRILKDRTLSFCVIHQKQTVYSLI